VVNFDRSFRRYSTGKYDAGLILQGQLTYSKIWALSLVDLGRWWLKG